MSQKLSKTDELYLQDMQNYLEILQHGRTREMEELRHLSTELNLIREKIKLTNKSLRLTDSRIKKALNDVKIFMDDKNKS